MTFVIVVNDRGQYSIWPQAKDVPAGWRVTGVPGSDEDCLARIAEEWTDIRPAGDP
jgi:MbtH protein